MLYHRLRVVFAIIAVVLMTSIGSSLLAAELRIARDKSSVSIFDGDRPILHYRYADVPMKPYADRLYSPAGVQVLRDAPHDHGHHHGLMYAQGVDGVNFWEEDRANSGKEVSASLGDVTAVCRNGVGRAGFVQELNWMGPAADKRLLVERRAIDVLQAADLGATLVEWRCRLQPPPGRDAMAIRGSFYFGLGLRLLASMDGGRFFYADDTRGEAVGDTGRLTPTAWCAYAANADGKPVTVAIFDHPANFRHPATMYTKTQPFAYLSATSNQWKQPFTVKAGKPLDLCYGVALWDGEVGKAAVEKLYRRWLALAKP